MGRQLFLVATLSLLLLVIDVARGKPSDDLESDVAEDVLNNRFPWPPAARGKPSDDLELESDVAEDVDTEAEMWSIVNRMADMVNERQVNESIVDEILSRDR